MRAVTMDDRRAPDHDPGQNGGAANARPKARATSGIPLAEHALLGLIAHVGGEAHGYELARYFDAGQSLGEVLHIEQSMLYQHLKKLERRGLLTVSLRPQGTRPPRQMYRITGDGRTELRRWLAEPVVRTREIRLEFPVKLFFALHLDRIQANRLIAEQLAVCEALMASLETQTAALGEPGAATPGDRERRFQRMVLELRLDQTRAAAVWLQRLAAWNPPVPPDGGS
jgi:DNA-binding PadR family transcriptional regulator